MLSAQSSVDDDVANDIQKALERMAVEGVSVANVIYDGMTLDEVERILRRDVTVVSDLRFVEDEPLMADISYHGNYLVFWSGPEYTDPIVIGHARRSLYDTYGEVAIEHNVLSH